MNEIFVSDNGGDTFINKGTFHKSPEWRTCLAIDPENSDRIYVTTGNKLVRMDRDTSNYKLTYTAAIHDDIHDINIDESSGIIYASTDGGLYSSSDKGKSWEEKNNGLNVAQCWSVSVTQNGPIKIISGLQDCGTVLYRTDSTGNRGWTTIRGGDGTWTAINPENDSMFFHADGNNKLFMRSTNSGLNWSANLAPAQPSTYSNPFYLNPQNPASVFKCHHDLYKSENYGDKMKKLNPTGNPDSKNTIAAMGIAPSDSNVIYVGYSNPVWESPFENKMFISEDGGNSWKDITKGLLAIENQNITSIAVDVKNPYKVYVGFHGAGAVKVMMSADGGRNSSWKDYSEGLQIKADVNALMFNKTNSVLYAATHRGVWKRADSISQWQICGEGLESVMVSALDIRYKNKKILFAGTHGKGIWQLNLDND
jgi:hypothetical protein